jgi:diguanylate cyclase (GGDEF)-like protein/PAS domain S-box-containing protein
MSPVGSIAAAPLARHVFALASVALVAVFIALGLIGWQVDRAALRDQLARDEAAVGYRLLAVLDRAASVAEQSALRVAANSDSRQAWDTLLRDFDALPGLRAVSRYDLARRVQERIGDPSFEPSPQVLERLVAGIAGGVSSPPRVLDGTRGVLYAASPTPAGGGEAGVRRGLTVAAVDLRPHFSDVADRGAAYAFLSIGSERETAPRWVTMVDPLETADELVAELLQSPAGTLGDAALVRVADRVHHRITVPVPEGIDAPDVGVVAWQSRNALLASHQRRRALGLFGLLAGLAVAFALLFAAVRLGRERIRSGVEGATRNLRDERDLFLAGPVVVFVWRPQPGWPVEYVSPNARDVLGYDSREMRSGGFRFTSLIHPDDVAEVERTSAAAIARGSLHWEQTYRIRRKDGSVRWLNDHTVADRDDKGRVRVLRGYLVDQTDYIELQRAREHQARTLDATLRGSPAVIYTESLETIGLTTYISENLRDVLGYAPADVIGDPLWWPQCLHPDDHARMGVVADWRHWSDATVLLSYRFRHADGSWRWIEDHCRVMYDGQGTALQLVGSLLDVTERVALEARLDKIAASLPGVIYQIRMYADGSFMFPYASEGVARYFGVAAEELADDGTLALTNLHPDDRERVLKSILDAARDRRPWHCEFRVYRPVGGMVWVEARAEQERLEDGSTLWHGFIIDVSRRKQIEEALAASRQQLDLAVDGADLALWDWDIAAERMDHSPRWARMFGYEPDELGTDTGVWESMVHPDDWAVIRSRLDAHLAGEQPMYEVEYRIRHRDGRWVWVLDRGRVMARTADGFPLRAAGTCLDITRQKQTEAALRQREWALGIAADAALDLLGAADLDATVNGVLRRLGEEAGVDRVYVFEAHDDSLTGRVLFTQRYEWVRPGVSPQIGNPALQNLDIEAVLPRWAEAFRKGDVIAGDVDSFPESEQRLLTEQEIRHLLAVPITLKDRWWGALGFDSVAETREWSETEEHVLRITAASIGAAIEHTRAEHATQLSNQRFQLAQRAISMGVWDWDVDRDALTWDDTMYRIYGLAPAREPIAYRGWLERVHPDDRVSVEQHLRGVLAGARDYDVELRILRSDGAVRWIQETAICLPEPGGRITRVVGVDIDITERRDSAEALRDSEARFRSLFELSPVGIVLSRLEDGQILDANLALLDRLGTDRDALLGRTVAELTADPPPGEAEEKRRELLANGVYGPLETELVAASGGRFPVLLSGALLTDRHGRQVVWTMVQDISERKRQELEMQRLAVTDDLTGLDNRRCFMERLEDEFARHQRTSSPTAVVVIDLDHFKRINDAHGHAVGDCVLRHFADTARAILRRTDTLGRLGGEEFGLLLPHTDITGAKEFVARLREAVAASPAESGSGPISIAFSAGISALRVGDQGVDEVLGRADRAMYRVKHDGRDNIAVET